MADEESLSKQRVRLKVQGVVQGVGFRPFVYRLAVKYGLTGFIQNCSSQVIIEVEGDPNLMSSFTDKLMMEARFPIRIDSISHEKVDPKGNEEFVISMSREEGPPASMIPPDISTCPHCMEELRTSKSRYYNYPFISCTHCGPRFSVVLQIPYDRSSTSMASFSLCVSCQKEYENMQDHRFHAQTIACPVCGPQVTLLNHDGDTLSGDWLKNSHQALQKDQILAVKGVGGFHLLCNAASRQAISSLRIRKKRAHKPLAIMAKDFESVQSQFYVSEVEAEAIKSPSAPIVLLAPKPELSRLLPLESIAPGLHRIGVMIPYTPLHYLLFTDEIHYLVVTSGNTSGMPTIYRNEEAIHQLRSIADVLLLHDRDIVMGCDDSVGQESVGVFQLMRRSRGYVPDSMTIPLPSHLQENRDIDWPTLLALGSDMKNSFCYIHQGIAYLSQHIGDLNTLEDRTYQQSAQDHIQNLLEATPALIVYDPHPNYISSQNVQKTSQVPLIKVYHHHAHMASCMAEHHIKTAVIGCILDGTGYGEDDTLWGFEILTGDYVSYQRIQYLNPFVLPGGEAAIRSPWMTGMSLLFDAAESEDQFREWSQYCFPTHRSHICLVLSQLQGNLPSPRISSAGRLLDGISAILNICLESTYEGEAAIQLSEVMEEENLRSQSIDISNRYPYIIEQNKWIIDGMIKELMQDYAEKVSLVEIVRKVHHTLASMIVEGVHRAKNQTGIRTVVLSGGVWNNRYLTRVTKQYLTQQGYDVYTHHKVPAGDGGIALGQALCGLWRWADEHVSIGSK
ncbi:carbamoyltransferase HypF [Paenibacillus illinoisensis]|uniref:carbamoyltransferase HypF n=1 Tax=Paenibacillus illinoisensis TaxID=59845 RepID=UPI0015E8853A|nr:carbamoyltransferase HypF [Paenibacillus illinoisensis]